MKLCLSLVLLGASEAIQTQQQNAATVAINPIRKVVNMLQSMQKKVTEEGEKEKELHAKFMCYCKSNVGNLEKGIANAKVKIPELGTEIEEDQSKKMQLRQEIKQGNSDRNAAKAAMADATAVRGKEHAAFVKDKTEADTNIKAMTKAIAALEKGMAGAFLQTPAAAVLKRLAMSNDNFLAADRADLLSFLSSTDGDKYAPQSGSIVGILKQMKDTMVDGLAKATSEDNSAAKTFSELIAAKTKEVSALDEAIESKTTRVGELGVKVVELKADLADTQSALAEDTKFLEDLNKNCATASKDWEVICKTRSEELLAIGDTIRVLNDDDALELFKKTLPSAGSVLLEVKQTGQAVRSRALEVLRSIGRHHPKLDLIAMSLSGRKVSFDKVTKMIDDMIAVLKVEQQDDNDKKEYCSTELDKLEDEKKVLDRKEADINTAIEDAKESIATLSKDITSLVEGIKELDESVKEASEQRKEEHKDVQELMQSDTTAKQVLEFAKNRLSKFYNPSQYKAPPKRELSEDERITLNMGGTLAPTEAPGGIAGTGISFAQVLMHKELKDAPPPPPEAVGAYKKKTEEGGGVIGMIDMLIADLDREMAGAEQTEKEAQADYEQMTADSAEKRTNDSKALSEKEAAKADAEAMLLSKQDKKERNTKELYSNYKVTQSVRAECDFILKTFDIRKEARANEMDALSKAKAVLSGANYLLVQSQAKTFLKMR